MQDMTLEQKLDTQNSTGIPATPPDVPEVKYKEAGKDDPTTPTYNMTDQEVRLQHVEEEYGIYMNTIGYEGDDSNLDSKTDSNSNVMAYPFLE